MHVLFVCTGNICRSPTAELLLRARSAANGWSVTASSAGTHAVVGHGVEPTAAQVLLGMGADPTGFSARALTPEMIDAAGLVLTMATEHRGVVLAARPAALLRTFTLREAALLIPDELTDEPVAAQLAARRRGGRSADLDVPDPIGRDVAAFTRASTLVRDALGRLGPIWAR